jgi:hypothetical protein
MSDDSHGAAHQRRADEADGVQVSVRDLGPGFEPGIIEHELRQNVRPSLTEGGPIRLFARSGHHRSGA